MNLGKSFTREEDLPSPLCNTMICTEMSTGFTQHCGFSHSSRASIPLEMLHISGTWDWPRHYVDALPDHNLYPPSTKTPAVQHASLLRPLPAHTDPNITPLQVPKPQSVLPAGKA